MVQYIRPLLYSCHFCSFLIFLIVAYHNFVLLLANYFATQILHIFRNARKS